MKHSLNNLVDYIVKASDGDVGKTEQFYFDDLLWRIRYMSVRTGQWLPNRSVLISMAALGKPDWGKKVFPVDLTKTQVSSSPQISIEEPVSRQHEVELHEHYAWPFYWGEFYIPIKYEADAVKSKEENPPSEMNKCDPHLHSTDEVMECRIHTTDGNIGHVEDFLVDDETWTIRYLVVNTRSWLPGRRVLVAPRWIKSVNWIDKELFVDLSKDAIKKCPKFDSSKPLSLEYEDEMLSHLQKPETKEWVVFKFHAEPKTKVYVAGTFNNWNPTSIKLGYSNKRTYTAMVLLPMGRHEYKYIVNGEWRNCPDCKEQVPNSFGTTNCVLVVGRTAAHDARRHTFSRQHGNEDHLQWSSPTS